MRVLHLQSTGQYLALGAPTRQVSLAIRQVRHVRVENSLTQSTGEWPDGVQLCCVWYSVFVYIFLSRGVHYAIDIILKSSRRSQ